MQYLQEQRLAREQNSGTGAWAVQSITMQRLEETAVFFPMS